MAHPGRLRSLAATLAAVLLAAAGVLVALGPDAIGGAPAPAARSVRAEPAAAVVPVRSRAAATTTTTAAPAPAAPAVAPAAPTPPPAPLFPPPLPRPDPVPPRWRQVPLVEIGRIQIPKLGLDQTVRRGVEQVVINAGPAWWPGTAEFGAWGNVVLAGHRSTYTEPFRRVAELAPGDDIVLSDLTGTYTYEVTGTQIVGADALWIVDQHPGYTLTIFTCHPIGSSAQRFVVRAQLVGSPRPTA